MIDRGRLRRPLHPPHRPRHRARGARGARTSSPGNRAPLEPGHAFSVEPGHLLPGPVRDAPRGHRGRDRRRARPAEPGAAATSPSSRRADPSSMRLEISTVMLQWAAGGLAFCWVRPGAARSGSATAGCCAASTRASPGSRSPRASPAADAGTRRARSSASRPARRSRPALVTFAVSVAQRRRRACAGLRERKEAGTGAGRGDDRQPARARAAGAARCHASSRPALDLVAPLCGLVGHARGGVDRRRTVRAHAVPAARRRGAARRVDRRDAARPLVPRAARARTASRSGSSSWLLAIVWLARRGRVPAADGGRLGVHRLDRRRVRRACSRGSGSRARSRPSCSRA